MLSRLAFRNAQALSVAARSIHTTAPSSSDVQRPKRREFASPVRHVFFPEEWFTFFHSKTGVSGPYAFATTFGTYLLSKEWYVIEHEFYTGVALFLLVSIAVKKFGPSVAAFLDKKLDEEENELNAGRESEIQANQQTIDDLEKEKWRTDGQKMIMEVKKQNIQMQLEATYRERLAQVYNEVKNRLEYHAQIDTVERRIAQKHMVQWIINSVIKSITPDQEKATLQQCINDLQTMSAKA